MKIWSMVGLRAEGRQSEEILTREQKQQQQKDEQASGGTQKKKKVTAAQLRVQKGGQSKEMAQQGSRCKTHTPCQQI